MRRLAVPAVITAVAAAVLAMLAFGIAHQGPNNSIAYSVASKHYKLAPAYHDQLPLLAGGQGSRSLADYRGKVVLVNLFASWCTDCQQEAGALRDAETLLSAHDGTVLGITYQDSPSHALGFVQEYHVDYPVVQDLSGNLANAFNVSGVPDSYLINRKGQIVALNLYQITDRWVQSTLPKFLGTST